MSVVRLTIARRKVQLGARASGGRVAIGVGIGDEAAADVVTPAKAEKFAAELVAAANKVRAAAATARRQKRPSFFRRFLPWGRA